MSWQLASLFFFGGVVCCVSLSRIMGIFHARKIIHRSFYCGIAIFVAITEIFEETGRKEYAESIKTNFLNLFFNSLPKNLHGLVPFKNWEGAKIWFSNFKDFS